MPIPKLTIMAAILLAGLSWTQLAAASCECGYLVFRGSQASVLFTNSIVTDFTDPNINDIGSDWWRTSNSISGDPGNVPPLLDLQYSVDNIYRDGEGLVVMTPAYSGKGPVGGGHPDLIDLPIHLLSELRTVLEDILYGSFRATMKTSSVQGVCQSLFFFESDSQEIDIELLTGAPNETGGTGSLHFTNQPDITPAPEAGFDPTADYHDYRIDWIPGKSQMWVDGVLRATLTQEVPNIPGKILFNSWSNGNPTWSQGPPKENALLRISSTTLYFNRTNAAENTAFSARCAKATGANKVCMV
ncbi:concanavalin A-like lectin/glucanase domain-containing protein [Jimgerdemannia flammicorona]|uniref:Concanavalin A-like lectin/glucanase domain-containing protein n=1 Tax=Jimgerdemannia flammicorona TaxID=994334 RepID=A0A433D645_9FUNG|nr:concanavalin A-like lectin/glucanase domain-containing protein [Jimgerdemannia flammicorona]